MFGPIAWGIAGLGMGIAYSTLSLVVLEHAGQGSEGTATAAIQRLLLNVLGSALGAGVGGALVAYTSRGDKGVGVGIFWQIMLMLAVLALALFTAQRLPNRTQNLARVGEPENAAPAPG